MEFGFCKDSESAFCEGQGPGPGPLHKLFH